MKNRNFEKDSVRRNLPFLGIDEGDGGFTRISITIGRPEGDNRKPMHMDLGSVETRALKPFKNGGRVNKSQHMGMPKIKMGNFSEAFCKKKMPAAFKSGGSVSNKKCGKKNMACGGKVNERSMPSHNDRHPMFKFLRDL